VANATSIEWTDFTSNPLKYRDRATGRDVWACVKHSPGCAHCYSEALARRYGRGGPFTRAATEQVEPYLDDQELRRLLAQKKLAGKRVFVGDMTDVFGDWVPDALLDGLFAVLALRQDVTFQVLTKRADRMRAYTARLAAGIGPLEAAARAMGRTFKFTGLDGREYSTCPWPLPNVWLGVSVEDQTRADERIPHLLDTPAAVRYLSCEPLLGPLVLNTDETVFYCNGCGRVTAGRDGDCAACGDCRTRERCYLDYLDWVVAGGESGGGARPCKVAWLRSLRDQCAAFRVAFFCKQLGSRPEGDDFAPAAADPATGLTTLEVRQVLTVRDRKGGDPAEWPHDLRVRQFPEPRRR